LMTNEVINDVCGIIPKEEVDAILETSRFQSLDTIIKTANDFFASGYDMRQFLSQLNEWVINKTDLTELEKGQICEIIMNKEASLLENSSANLALYSLMSEIRKIFTMS
jgi:DNA polymerase III gamma/tau subunit